VTRVIARYNKCIAYIVDQKIKKEKEIREDVQVIHNLSLSYNYKL